MTTKELSEQEIEPVAYLIEWGADKNHPTGKRLSFGPSFAPEDVCNELYHESIVTALHAEIERLKKQLVPSQIDERAEFEKFMRGQLFPDSYFFKSPLTNLYTNQSIQSYWLGWQARAQLEKERIK